MPTSPISRTTLRHYMYNLLHNDDFHSPVTRIVDGFLIALILANVASVVMGSISSWYLDNRYLFDNFEYFSIVIFSTEFLLRLWSVAESNSERSAWHNRWRWLTSPYAFIDMIAIVPAYINFFVPINLHQLIVLRLLRLFKLTRYFSALRLLLKVIAREKESFKAVLFIFMILMILTASGIHLVEHQAQPDKFDSIPKSMWWAVVTLTTVGYGDVTPVTTAGKILGAIITILGVGIAALPAGILASGLANELNLNRERLEMEFREMLLTNEIDLEKDKAGIEKLYQKLGVNKGQALLIVEQVLKEKKLQEDHSQYINYCPHCGHSLHGHHDTHKN